MVDGTDDCLDGAFNGLDSWFQRTGALFSESVKIRKDHKSLDRGETEKFQVLQGMVHRNRSLLIRHNQLQRSRDFKGMAGFR